MNRHSNDEMEIAPDSGELRRLRRELVLGASARLGRRPRMGFVPTMGALHAGHGSLIEKMAAECDVCAVSIFVNPKQFGPGEDLDKYPRSLEADLELCRQAGAQLVFCPQAADVYPAGFQTKVLLPELSARWCGASRPGHFDGVATVVLKLFELLLPDRAYFGEKDYQQLRIIQRMAEDLALLVEVVPCPTLREADGLALSSRNSYLNAEQRSHAHELYAALSALRTAVAGGQRDALQLAAIVQAQLESSPADWEVEYLAIVDPQSLEPRSIAEAGDRVLAAARLGNTRLIDNLAL